MAKHEAGSKKGRRSSDLAGSLRLARVLLVIFGIALILVAVVWGENNQSLVGLALVGAGSLILAAVLPVVRTVKLPGVFEAKLTRRIEAVESRSARVLLMAMSEEAYTHLRNLASNKQRLDYKLDEWVRDDSNISGTSAASRRHVRTQG
jgi:Na+(H+)/acetate symporter ActP